MKKMTTIAIMRYENLLSKEAHLEALQALGVEEWGGYVDEYVKCPKCSADNTWELLHCVSCGEVLTEVRDLFEKETV